MIKTDKVYIREISKADLADLKEYLQDEFVMRFFDHGVLDDKAIELLVERKDITHGIIDLETDKLIGHFVYHQWFMIDTYEIGWVMNKDYHNHGIMTDLANAFIKYAFEVDKAHRVVATCQPENQASKRVCEKTGMRLEGHFKKCIYVKRKDEWWDELFYSILDEDYFGG
jgi:RimJ/RimL family protein N-acetyltransferase